MRAPYLILWVFCASAAYAQPEPGRNPVSPSNSEFAVTYQCGSEADLCVTGSHVPGKVFSVLPMEGGNPCHGSVIGPTKVETTGDPAAKLRMEACSISGDGLMLAFAGRLQAGDYERLQVAAMNRPAEAAQLASNWYKTYPRQTQGDYELVPEQALALRLPNFEDGVYVLRLRGKHQEHLPKATVGGYYLSVRGKLEKLDAWSYWKKAFKLKGRYFIELHRTCNCGDVGTLVFELAPAGARLRLNDGSFST